MIGIYSDAAVIIDSDISLGAFQLEVSFFVKVITVSVKRDLSVTVKQIPVTVSRSAYIREVAAVLELFCDDLHCSGVYSRVDLKSLCVYSALSCVIIHIVLFHQICNYRIDEILVEIRIDAAGGFQIRVYEFIKCEVIGFVIFFLIDQVLPEHEVERKLTPLPRYIVCDNSIGLSCNNLGINNILRLAGELEKGIGVRGLRQSGQGSALYKIQVFDFFGKICAGCCIYAVTAVSQINSVKIRLYYLFLAEVVLQPVRIIHLKKLTPDAADTLDISKIYVTRQLLCDRTRAAYASASGKGGENGSYHSGPVEPVMFPEGLVLDRNKRVYQIFRHVFIFDDFTVLCIEDVIYLFSFIVIYD